MTSETWLTLAMMGAVLVVFLLLHMPLRRVVYDNTAPREGWKWPVWSWYPLVLAIGILVALASNLYWSIRQPEQDVAREESEIRPVKGEDATPTPTSSPMR